MKHPFILYFESKQTCMNRPKREELSLRMVFALPEKQALP